MDFRKLRYFVAIAEQGSIGKAAEKLFIAQPALSRQISELEAELQVRLFDRLPRGVSLTVAGKVFLDDVRSMLANFEHAKTRALHADSGKIGKLDIGLIEYFSWHESVVQPIEFFRQDQPSVALTLSTWESSLDILERVADGQLDCGFSFNRSADDARLCGATVLSVGFLLAVPASSHLAKRKTLHMSDLANEPFVWIPRKVAPVHYDRLLMMCNGAGFSPNIAQVATTESGRLSLVAAGVGCAIVTSASELWKPQQVTLIRLVDVKLKIDLELVWHAENNSPTLKLFREAVTRSHGTAHGKRGKAIFAGKK